MTPSTPEGPAATRQHWADCAVNHGGAECDMGPECGLDLPPREIDSLRARLVEVEREATASRACIEFDPPSEPAQIVARLRLIVENHNKQCGDFVTQRNSAWQRTIEIGKAKKAAESRASAAEGALRAIAACCEAREKAGADPMQAEFCDYEEHKIARLALSGLPPLTRMVPMLPVDEAADRRIEELRAAQPTPAALVPKEEDK